MTQEQENKFLSLIKEKCSNAFNDWNSKGQEYNKTRSLQLLEDYQELKGTIEAYLDVIYLFELIQAEEE